MNQGVHRKGKGQPPSLCMTYGREWCISPEATCLPPFCALCPCFPTKGHKLGPQNRKGQGPPYPFSLGHVMGWHRRSRGVTFRIEETYLMVMTTWVGGT